MDIILSRQTDIFRSVWDRKSLLAVLDIDYTNADLPYQGFTDPAGTFAKLEPVYQTVLAELDSFGIKHLSIMTGQGYHFVFRIPLSGTVAKQLRELYPLSQTIASKYRYDHPFTEDKTSPDDGAALLRTYLRSPLHAFHDYFAAGHHDNVNDWPGTYDRVNLANLPPCVSLPLSRPNPALSVPNNLRNVARVLVSLGWHPRSVAGLIRSKWERDYGWGINWLTYDAATRADFYVRLFCGLIADGADDLRDFNCVSHQEHGFCPRPWCGHNLADYKAESTPGRHSRATEEGRIRYHRNRRLPSPF